MSDLQDHIAIYVSNAVKHGEGTLSGDYKLANKSYDAKMKALKRILEFGNAGRDEILLLLNHDNDSVRTSAAAHSLGYNEELALETLEEVASGDDIISLNAEMVIKEWKGGRLKVP